MEPTREVFGNIAPWMRVLFYALVFASLTGGAWPVCALVRRWRAGVPGERERDWRSALRRLWIYGAGQRRVRRLSLGGILHALIFSGFVVLAIGTTLLFLAHSGPVNFHHGSYYLGYELVMDTFGVALIAGCLLAIYRRLSNRPSGLGHNGGDFLLLGLFLAIAVTGFAVEALRLIWARPTQWIAHWSPVGDLMAVTVLRGLSPMAAKQAHLWTWWLHVALILLFFAVWARTRFLHVFTGSLNLMLRPSRPAGALLTIPMEEVERTGKIGIESTADLTRQQLLSLDACMECGRCQQACPAYASGKPLSPETVVQDLRRAAAQPIACQPASHLPSPSTLNPQLSTPAPPPISPETLWSCTMCQACVFECPVLIGQVDLIAGMRRALIGGGQLSGPPALALRRISAQGNPYGRPPAERLDWASGLDLPTVEQEPAAEVLLWVGCAAAYDPRAQKVARATAKLLRRAGVRFAVMAAERCTGDPARRMGDEFLFQQRAEENVIALKSAGACRIVTPCPHCMNTLRHEYPDFGGEFQVLHHSQFLAELVATGSLPAATSPQGASVTLHDPCYLARVNGETDAPRAVLAAAGAALVEMPRHGRRTFCCGAGGGRIFFEERPEQRVNRLRASEALATGAGTLATACPFCLNMMTDGMAGTPGADAARVMDVSELLLEALEAGGEAGNPRTPASEDIR